MATFDIISFVFGIMGLLVITGVTAWLAGKNDWTIQEFFASLSSVVLWQNGMYSPKVMVGMWIFSIAFSWYFDMAWCFWTSIVIIGVAALLQIFLRKHTKQVVL